jgi:hypothetical protein
MSSSDSCVCVCVSSLFGGGDDGGDDGGNCGLVSTSTLLLLFSLRLLFIPLSVVVIIL